MLFGFFAVGAWVALFLARKRVPFREHQAYDQLKLSVHAKKRNAWFIALPIAVVISFFSSAIVIWGLATFNVYETLTKMMLEEEQLLQEKRSRDIDITPQALQKMNSKDILRYAHGYFNGRLVDAKGRGTELYTQSKYKSLNMLRFLARERDDNRAKFLVGLLSGDTNSLILMQDAMKAGDPFAQMYSSIQFGCRGKEDMAKQLLNRQLKIASDRLIKSEIESALYVGIKSICQEFEQPEFHWLYVKQYKPF